MDINMKPLCESKHVSCLIERERARQADGKPMASPSRVQPQDSHFFTALKELKKNSFQAIAPSWDQSRPKEELHLTLAF